jgi:ferric-dicitrate binding protein FerR (iron transport regulator)
MNRDRWIEWIRAYCRHEMSTGEREAWMAWMAEDEANREAWREAVARYRMARRGAAWKRVDDERAWMRLAERVKTARMRRRRGTWGVAAAVAAVAVGVALFLTTRGGEERVALSWQELRPGETRAVLHLPGGRELVMGREVAMEDSSLGFRGLRDTAGLSYRPANETAREPRREGEYHTIVIPRKGEYFVVLSDGSQVWLNADSELRYPVRFGDGRREVYLSGEAYFSVAGDSTRPFVVVSRGTRVEALGTRFNVAAYRDESRVVATLETGAVRVSAGGVSRVLAPGTRAVVEEDGLRVEPADVEMETGWTHRVFAFVEMPLGDITRQLQRWYDVEFVYDEPALATIPFTGTVGRDLPLQDLLEVIERLADIHFSLLPDRIEVTRRR